MKKNCIKSTVVCLITLWSSVTYASEELVSWDSIEGQKRFASSQHKVDFFKLSNNFVAQDNKIVCGLASSSIILNALRLRAKKNIPQDLTSIAEIEKDNLPKNYDPFFRRYTQNNILNKETKSRKEVFGKPIDISGVSKKDYGLQLRQLAKIFSSYKTRVIQRVVHKKMDKNSILKELKRNLETANDYVLVNYSRKILGQPGGGHISPLAAYDQSSDSFLIMDVNPNKAPWVWVKSTELIKAMRTFDTVENRGYLLIKDR